MSTIHWGLRRIGLLATLLLNRQFYYVGSSVHVGDSGGDHT